MFNVLFTLLWLLIFLGLQVLLVLSPNWILIALNVFWCGIAFWLGMKYGTRYGYSLPLKTIDPEQLRKWMREQGEILEKKRKEKGITRIKAAMIKGLEEEATAESLAKKR